VARRGLSPTGQADVRAVLFDVDFTLSRPGPALSAAGYRTAGSRLGLELEEARYAGARAAAMVELRHHPELDHDLDVWVRFTEEVIRGMGGSGPAVARLAVAIVEAWDVHENHDLYEDVAPTFARLRAAGLRIGLVSNSARDLGEFARHHGLAVDAVVSSGFHGKVKPHPTIFRAALELLETAPARAVMVGDSPADDVEGARAVGMHAVLVDRHDLQPPAAGAIRGLAPLPGLLGLPAA
jgi:putative hydrolase of the HAD superfamily